MDIVITDAGLSIPGVVLIYALAFLVMIIQVKKK